MSRDYLTGGRCPVHPLNGLPCWACARGPDPCINHEAGLPPEMRCPTVMPSRASVAEAQYTALLTRLRALREKWQLEADHAEADGDYCCSVTRQHDVDDLALLVDPVPQEKD